jgi:D-amino-acid dehydrogenase
VRLHAWLAADRYTLTQVDSRTAGRAFARWTISLMPQATCTLLPNDKVLVLGAGIVGVSCALALQARGVRHITLLDRQAPGRETSFGNAGVVSRASLMPFNHPGLWRNLPRLLRHQSPGFRFNARYLLQNMRWASSFLRHARAQPCDVTCTALDGLLALSTQQHRAWLAQARGQTLWRDDGWLYLYRNTDAYRQSLPLQQTLTRFGVAHAVLTAADLHDLEPSIAPHFSHALWVQDAASVSCPSAVVQTYADLFAAQGGVVLRDEAVAVARQAAETGQALVTTASGRQLDATHVVVALGPWSATFLQRLGLHVPMAMERGYHIHYAAKEGAVLQRPIFDTAGGYVLSPTQHGLRLSTGVELNAQDAPQTVEQLALAEQAARTSFPLGSRLDAAPWMGCRPTLPDSRPVIGAVTQRPGLWLAFGHQHIGFATGPGTGTLLAALMHGDKPPIPAKPFAPERWITARR